MRNHLKSTIAKTFSVEWNLNVAEIQTELFPAVKHFVLPDLPAIFSDDDRVEFSKATEPNQRIHTIATCQHENAESLLNSVSNVEPGSKILLVSGNDRGPNRMSSIDAARILQNEHEHDIWGVANPNDLKSLDAFEKKLESGIKGFITQPLFASHARDTMQMYRNSATEDITILTGLAFPKNIRELRFWAKLLDQGDELERDPLFQSHIAYFSGPHFASMSWIRRELEDLLKEGTTNDSCKDGIHFMPMKNVEGLCDIFSSLNDTHLTSSDTNLC